MGLIGQDFFKWRGDTFKIRFVVEDAETDLSSYKVYWSVAEDEVSTPVLVKTTSGDFTGEGGIIWESGNVIEISLSKSDTDSLPSFQYYHELAIENDQTGESVVIASGEFDLKRALFEEIRNN